jgi:hypothetical protein
VTFEALLAVVTANGGALRELDALCCTPDGAPVLTGAGVDALLHAAPALRSCRVRATVHCDRVAAACAMLRNEGLYAGGAVGATALRSCRSSTDARGAAALAPGERPAVVIHAACRAPPASAAPVR